LPSGYDQDSYLPPADQRFPQKAGFFLTLNLFRGLGDTDDGGGFDFLGAFLGVLFPRMGAPKFENKGEIKFPGFPEQFLLLGGAQFMEVVKNMILIEFPEERKRFSSIHGVIIGEKSQDRKAEAGETHSAKR
jgi:hypothetical protein